MQDGNGNKKQIVIARLTVTKTDGERLIVEVWQDASFQNFYHYFTQSGNRRSTKRQIRTANRNEGIRPHYMVTRTLPGLEVLEAQFKKSPFMQIKKIALRIIKKKLYKKMISTPAAELGTGLVKIAGAGLSPISLRDLAIRIHIPRGYLTIKQRMDIILGRS